MAERGKPGHVGGVEWVSAGREMFKGGRGVDRLPEDDDVDHDAEAVELVFLPDLVVLAELAALPVEDVAGPASCGEPPTDLGLPDVPGETVARELRAAAAVPIVMLTAKSRGRRTDRRAGAGRR